MSGPVDDESRKLSTFQRTTEAIRQRAYQIALSAKVLLRRDLRRSAWWEPEPGMRRCAAAARRLPRIDSCQILIEQDKTSLSPRHYATAAQASSSKQQSVSIWFPSRQRSPNSHIANALRCSLLSGKTNTERTTMHPSLLS